MTVTKISRGLYEVRVGRHTFEIEDIGQASDGEIPAAWMLYEITYGSCGATREFWNDFTTLRAAKAAITAFVSKDA